jgi:Kdo2-lipid IVA lauroyltransferase/acyltransferase
MPARSMLLQAPLTLGIRALMNAALGVGNEAAPRIAESLGRAYATVPWNRRRLARAEGNLRIAFPDWPEPRVHEYAVRSYEHLFRICVEIGLAPRRLTEEGWLREATVGAIAPALRTLVQGKPCLLISGHVGNWEIIGYTVALLGFPMHALYRPIDLVPLDRWMRSVRGRRGLVLVDKFGALKQLPEILSSGGCLGVVADQNGGDRGVFVPFFNRLTSTYKSVGLLAMQFGATIICGCARRFDQPPQGPVVSPAASPELRSELESFIQPDPHPGRRPANTIEITDLFGPEAWSQHPDPIFYLTARYRLAIETMIRRAPGQYDWMHRVWRSRPKHERLQRPFPDALREKIRLLPWIRESDLDQILEHTARDTRTLAQTGQSRLS